jgi:hypothetical protein
MAAAAREIRAVASMLTRTSIFPTLARLSEA